MCTCGLRHTCPSCKEIAKALAEGRPAAANDSRGTTYVDGVLDGLDMAVAHLTGMRTALLVERNFVAAAEIRNAQAALQELTDGFKQEVAS